MSRGVAWMNLYHLCFLSAISLASLVWSIFPFIAIIFSGWLRSKAPQADFSVRLFCFYCCSQGCRKEQMMGWAGTGLPPAQTCLRPPQTTRDGQAQVCLQLRHVCDPHKPVCLQPDCWRPSVPSVVWGVSGGSCGALAEAPG